MNRKNRNTKLVDLRTVRAVALRGDGGFETGPRSSEGETAIMGQSASVNALDNPSSVLQADAVALGTISADMAPVSDAFSVDNDEVDLDCPTEGFSSIAEAIEDIRQGKVCYECRHVISLYFLIFINYFFINYFFMELLHAHKHMYLTKVIFLSIYCLWKS